LKRKLLIGLVALMTISGTAYAATAINGLYKGRSIVAVTVNGQPVKSDVPGQIIDGSTMLPLRAIAESLGAQVDWVQDKYRADIMVKQQPSIQPVQQPVQPVKQGLSLEQLNKIGESVGMITALDASGKAFRAGSGFVINGNVLITNHHVIEGSSSLKITYGLKETILKSEYIFDDAELDITAMRFDGAPSLKVGPDPKEGQEVYALGYPQTKFTISEGEVTVYTQGYNILHSAKTDKGSSGGPVINDRGEVIGVTFLQPEGTTINDAIPIKKVIEKLNN